MLFSPPAVPHNSPLAFERRGQVPGNSCSTNTMPPVYLSVYLSIYLSHTHTHTPQYSHDLPSSWIALYPVYSVAAHCTLYLCLIPRNPVPFTVLTSFSLPRSLPPSFSSPQAQAAVISLFSFKKLRTSGGREVAVGKYGHDAPGLIFKTDRPFCPKKENL